LGWSGRDWTTLAQELKRFGNFFALFDLFGMPCFAGLLFGAVAYPLFRILEGRFIVESEIVDCDLGVVRWSVYWVLVVGNIMRGTVQ
jgi:uncharacterized membrane protein YedE/YeeE